MNKKRIYESTVIGDILDVIFEHENIPSAMPIVLEMIGKYFAADRVCIFESTNGSPNSKNLHEWCAGDGASLNDNIQHTRYQDGLDCPLSALFKGNSVWQKSDVSQMEDGQLKRLFLKQRVKAVILVALFEFSDFVGCIELGFRDTKKAMLNEQVKVLQIAAKVISYMISGKKYSALRGLTVSLQEESKDLKAQLSTERKAFFDVMGNNALFTVHSDLTDGLIVEDILAPDGSSLLAALGFSVPAPYDEEGRAFIEANQVEMITPNAARCFQHKNAIKIFHEGIGSAPYDIYIGSTDMYVRMNVIFYKNQDNDHIMCYCMCTDISEQYKEIRQLKKLETVNEQLQYEASHDGSTGLLNRATAEKIIADCIKINDSQAYALILIDIDNFKAINDHFGHAAGDRAIQKVAETMRRTFRQTDVLCRFGGDEFVVFIRDLSDDAALTGRITDFLSRVSEPMNGPDTVISFSCSAGFTIVRNGETDFDTLYHQADDALYRAKNQGKNGCAKYS